MKISLLLLLFTAVLDARSLVREFDDLGFVYGNFHVDTGRLRGVVLSVDDASKAAYVTRDGDFYLPNIEPNVFVNIEMVVVRNTRIELGGNENSFKSVRPGKFVYLGSYEMEKRRVGMRGFAVKEPGPIEILEALQHEPRLKGTGWVEEIQKEIKRLKIILIEP